MAAAYTPETASASRTRTRLSTASRGGGYASLTSLLIAFACYGCQLDLYTDSALFFRLQIYNCLFVSECISGLECAFRFGFLGYQRHPRIGRTKTWRTSGSTMMCIYWNRGEFEPGIKHSCFMFSIPFLVGQKIQQLIPFFNFHSLTVRHISVGPLNKWDQVQH